jgi:hypothetical protein
MAMTRGGDAGAEWRIAASRCDGSLTVPQHDVL